MLKRKVAGFTIIEVVIFIALSSAMVLVALFSVGGKQQRVVFGDAMRGLQAFVETQYSVSLNGVNDNPNGVAATCGATTGGTSLNCVILGRVLVFGGVNGSQPQSIDYFSVVGDIITADKEIACGSEPLLQCAKPRTDTQLRSSELDWGVSFVGGVHTRSNGVQVPSRAIAFLRNPRSSAVSPVSYSLPPSGGSLLDDVIENSATYQTGSTLSYAGADVDAYYCFVDGSNELYAAITIVGSQIDLVFDPNLKGYSC